MAPESLRNVIPAVVVQLHIAAARVPVRRCKWSRAHVCVCVCVCQYALCADLLWAGAFQIQAHAHGRWYANTRPWAEEAHALAFVRLMLIGRARYKT